MKSPKKAGVYICTWANQSTLEVNSLENRFSDLSLLWELDCEEGWAPKNWCFWTVVLGKTLESPLDCKEIQPIHSEGYQPWDFFGRNDAKAETPVLWPPHVKSVMDRETWHAAIHGITKSWTRLSDWTELNSSSRYNKLKSWKRP